MIELVAIAALAFCIVVISVVVRIYKESPKISKQADDDEEFNNFS